MGEFTSRMILGLIVGGGIAGFGLFELVWGVRTFQPRSTIAQGGYFLLFGLSFVTMSLVSDPLLRNGLAGALFVGALWSAWTQHEAARAEREAPDLPRKPDSRE